MNMPPESSSKNINYWYFRYLLVTELYMVEKWERIMIHIVFFIIFSIISIFNSYVILGIVSHLLQSPSEVLNTANIPPILAADVPMRMDL